MGIIYLVPFRHSVKYKTWYQWGDAENARHENARNAKVWNTACCICLSIAEQEYMSRQERAPDFAANCVLVND